MGRGTRFVVRLSLHGTVHFRETISAWALLSHWPGNPGKPLEAPFLSGTCERSVGADSWAGARFQTRRYRAEGSSNLDGRCQQVNRSTSCTCSNAIDWYFLRLADDQQDPIPTPPAPNANPNTKTELGTKYLKKHAANPPRPSRIPTLGPAPEAPDPRRSTSKTLQHHAGIS
jgi:hypothetical protein